MYFSDCNSKDMGAIILLHASAPPSLSLLSCTSCLRLFSCYSHSHPSSTPLPYSMLCSCTFLRCCAGTCTYAWFQQTDVQSHFQLNTRLVQVPDLDANTTTIQALPPSKQYPIA